MFRFIFLRQLVLFVPLIFSGIAAAGQAGNPPANLPMPTLPKSGANLQAFVPQGWEILAKAEGDLNKDGKSDAALVLKNRDEGNPDIGSEEGSRLLVLLFQNAQGGYDLSAVSRQEILCKMCGGMLGDPFESLTIDRGSVLIKEYGGSRDRWGYTHRYRYQNGGWYLIGETTLEADNLLGTSTEVDTNLLTGDQVITQMNREKKSTKSNKVPVKPLKKLEVI